MTSSTDGVEPGLSIFHVHSLHIHILHVCVMTHVADTVVNGGAGGNVGIS